MLYVCYHFIIGTVDTPSLQGRIAALGDVEKVHLFVYAYVYVCAHMHASMYVLVFTYIRTVCVFMFLCVRMHVCIRKFRQFNVFLQQLFRWQANPIH